MVIYIVIAIIIIIIVAMVFAPKFQTDRDALKRIAEIKTKGLQ